MPPRSGDTESPAATTQAISAVDGRSSDVVDLDARSVLVATITVVALAAIVAIARSGTTTILVALAALFAFALDPIIVRLERKLRIRRGYAVAILVGGSLFVVVLAITVLGPQTVDQARSFQDDLPHVVQDLSTLPVVGSRLRDKQIPDHIQTWAANLPKQFHGDTAQITNVAETITSALLDAIAVALIMVALLLDGPWLIRGARRLIPPQRRVTAHRLGRILGRVIGRYFAGSLVLATLQGLQVLITGIVLSVPLSPLLALWAGVWNMVPQIGGGIGGIVFVLVAFTQGATTGVIAAIVFMIYLTFANNALLPVILGRAVNVSPLMTMVATIGGFAVAGVIGAMVAVPIVGTAKAIYFELRPGASLPDSAIEDPRPAGIYRRTRERLRQRRSTPPISSP